MIKKWDIVKEKKYRMDEIGVEEMRIKKEIKNWRVWKEWIKVWKKLLGWKWKRSFIKIKGKGWKLGDKI